jgi:DNA end-binding protein Ku
VAARAYWKGYLKLSLVACPIALNPASSASERISFRQINKKTGNRLRQQLVDEVTREVVEGEDKGRGYEVDKGVYLPVDDEEIEAIQIDSKHTIEIDRFVPAAQIDKRFYDAPYYVTPNDDSGQEAFAVIRDAMKGKGVVALGRVVLNKRERVLALEPHKKGLLGTTLRYPYEMRKSDDYFDAIENVKVSGEMLKLAEHILETKKGDFDPSEFEDHYETALVELMKKKQAGFKPSKAKEPVSAPQNVINLMDALRKSVQGGRGASAPQKKGAKKRVAGQTEMLLSIAGKGRAAGKSQPLAKKAGGRRKAG